MLITLNQDEISILDRQDPSTRTNGGFQSFLVSLQERLDRDTGEISLTDKDLRRIPQYAFDYAQGGWEDRLNAIFSRSLGPTLGR